MSKTGVSINTGRLVTAGTGPYSLQCCGKIRVRVTWGQETGTVQSQKRNKSEP